MCTTTIFRRNICFFYLAECNRAMRRKFERLLQKQANRR